MKRTLSVIALLVVLATVAASVIAATTNVSDAPGILHRWLLLPAACAEARCVTYRRWAAVVRASGSEEDAADILTSLLTARAVSLVARRSGLSVSAAEVDAALETLDELVAEQPELAAFVASQYEEGTKSRAFRKGVRDLLVRRKLAAAGIVSPWTHATAPAVTFLTVRYRWDEANHRVVAR